LSATTLTVLTFLAVAMAVVGAYSLLSDVFQRDRSRVSRRVDKELRRRQRERVRTSALFKNLSTTPLPGAAAEALPSNSPRARFEAMLEQSGLFISQQRLLTYMAVTGLVLGVTAGLIHFNPLTGLLAGIAGAAIPFAYVYVKRRKRMDKMMSQLPDAFELMARVIRAGQTMSQSIQAVADEFDAPLSAEFAYCYEQQNLGLAPEASLRDLGRRTGLLEIKIFVLALLVQQQTGGNLAELLDKLSFVIRERSKIQGKIRALTAEGRFQALVLLALPPVILLAIMFFNPDYAKVLFRHPTLLIGTFVSEAFGYVWIRRIVNFDF
jgi:tight adherence protein B